MLPFLSILMRFISVPYWYPQGPTLCGILGCASVGAHWCCEGLELVVYIGGLQW
jgi:hypothetical protein